MQGDVKWQNDSDLSVCCALCHFVHCNGIRQNKPILVIRYRMFANEAR